MECTRSKLEKCGLATPPPQNHLVCVASAFSYCTNQRSPTNHRREYSGNPAAGKVSQALYWGRALEGGREGGKGGRREHCLYKEKRPPVAKAIRCGKGGRR